jgi:hypothetical protein
MLQASAGMLPIHNLHCLREVGQHYALNPARFIVAVSSLKAMNGSLAVASSMRRRKLNER